MTRSSRILVRTTCILMAFAISGPAMDLIDPLVRHLPSFLRFVLAPFALLDFLDYAFGKAACILFAVCVLLLLLSSGINWWTKTVLTSSAAVSCYMTLHWVEKMKHLW